MRVAGIPLGVGQNTLNPSPLTLALLHFDTNLADSAPIPHTFNTGSAGQKISTLNPKFGVGSMLTNGSVNGALNASFNLASQLSNQNFTVEGWFSQLAASTEHRGLFMITNQPDSSATAFPILIYVINQTLVAGIQFSGESLVTITHQTSTQLNQYSHFALVRNNGIITLYLEGVASSSTIIADNKTLESALYVHVGQSRAGAGTTLYSLNGYLDEFRIRKEAVYTSNFTPPTAPFTY